MSNQEKGTGRVPGTETEQSAKKAAEDAAECQAQDGGTEAGRKASDSAGTGADPRIGGNGQAGNGADRAASAADAGTSTAEGGDETESAADAGASTADGADEPGSAASDAEPAASGESSQEAKETKDDEALNAKYLRLMADFQNYKRRAEKEKSDSYAFATEKLVSQLLPVVDSFERALAHESSDESFAEGMRMIFRQLMDELTKAGVAEIEALGQDFDPNFHSAVMMEDSDEYESGKVTFVMQKGYVLNNKVIRPAMVKVSN